MNKIIGYDLGNTITSKLLPSPHIIDNAFEVISKLTKKFDETYIVSRVNSEQRERALRWFETTDFFNQTGIKESNVYFCFDRRDKAVFVRGLEINVFIDDRLDVLRHLECDVLKIAFCSKDFQHLQDFYPKPPRYDLCFVENWLDVERLLL